MHIVLSMKRSRFFFWLAIVFGVIGVIGTTFSIVTFYTSRPVARIEGALISHTPYKSSSLETSSDHTVDVQIRFDGEDIDDLSHLVFRVANTGNTTIRREDLETLYVYLDPSNEVLTADIKALSDNDMAFDIYIEEGSGSVHLDFAFLEPGEWVSLLILARGADLVTTPTLKGRSIATIENRAEYSDLVATASTLSLWLRFVLSVLAGLIAFLTVFGTSTLYKHLRQQTDSQELVNLASRVSDGVVFTTLVENLQVGEEEGRIVIGLLERQDEVHLEIPLQGTYDLSLDLSIDVHRKSLPKGISPSEIMFDVRWTNETLKLGMTRHHGFLPQGIYILTFDLTVVGTSDPDSHSPLPRHI